MDNLTHSLVGWALSQAGLKSKTRKGAAALILGANLPDIDVFFGRLPWASLATHRGFSHSLLGGVIILPALLAVLLWLLDKWQNRRAAAPSGQSPMDVRWLALLSYLGAVTHSLLDLQTSYAVQLFAPWTSRWMHSDTLFIIDAFVLAILIAAIWLSYRRERRGAQWRTPAIAGLAALSAYIALNGAISLAARNALQVHLGFAPSPLYARSVPVSFWERELVWRAGGRIGMASFNPLRSLVELHAIQPPFPDQMRHPLVLRAIAVTPGLDSFLRWSTMPVAIVKSSGCEARVEFGDARFMAMGVTDAFPAIRPFAEPPVVIPIATAGCRGLR